MSAQTKPETQVDEAQEVEVKTFTREEALAQIFGAKPKGSPTTLFGVPVELREPSLDEVLDAQNSEDKKRSAVDMIIRFTYLPGSSERLFGDEHVESLLSLPFGKDLQQLQKAIGQLLGMDVTDEDKSQAPQISA